MATERETTVEVEVEVAQPGEEPCAQDSAPDADGQSARLASLEAQLELAQEKGRETFARLKEEHEARLRAAADLENFKKRAQREREEVQRFGSERLLKDLLPVVDNLDRALAAAPAGDPMARGVELVRKGLEEALLRHGVEAFSGLGQPFDPRRHEALAQLEVPGAEPGSVVAEHGRGFLLHGRLLRPAMVAVAPARREEPSAQPAEAGPDAQGGDAPAAPPEGSGE
jgi:molecular chaperone GrpE